MEGGGEDWTDSAGQKSWRRAFVAKRFGANETGTEGPFYRVLGDAKLRRSNTAGPSSNGRTPDFGFNGPRARGPFRWFPEHEFGRIVTHCLFFYGKIYGRFSRDCFLDQTDRARGNVRPRVTGRSRRS